MLISVVAFSPGDPPSGAQPFSQAKRLRIDTLDMEPADLNNEPAQVQTDVLSPFGTGERDDRFAPIVRQYRNRIYWTVRSLVNSHDDAEDITQETLIAVWKNLDRFRHESALWGWIYRIAFNNALGHLRRLRSRHEVAFDAEDLAIESDARSDAAVLTEEFERLVRTASDRLPPKQRQVFHMRYYGDFKYEELSLMLQRDTGTLKANYHHATRKVEYQIRSLLAEP